MRRCRHGRTAVVLTSLALLSGALAGCSSSEPQALDPQVRNLQPGLPGEPNEVLTEVEDPIAIGSSFTEADAAFMADMQVHHQQALTMTALVPSRAQREDLELFTRRMDISQEGELAQLEAMLADHEAALERIGESHGGGHSGHTGDGDHSDMPGMLSDAEMAALETAEGEDFVRLFLAAMTKHHVGALSMVEELFSVEGTAADPRLYAFASHVESDQRIEIERMARMMAELPPV